MSKGKVVLVLDFNELLPIIKPLSYNAYYITNPKTPKKRTSWFLLVASTATPYNDKFSLVRGH